MTLDENTNPNRVYTKGRLEESIKKLKSNQKNNFQGSSLQDKFESQISKEYRNSSGKLYQKTNQNKKSGFKISEHNKEEKTPNEEDTEKTALRQKVQQME